MLGWLTVNLLSCGSSLLFTYFQYFVQEKLSSVSLLSLRNHFCCYSPGCGYHYVCVLSDTLPIHPFSRSDYTHTKVRKHQWHRGSTFLSKSLSLHSATFTLEATNWLTHNTEQGCSQITFLRLRFNRTSQTPTAHTSHKIKQDPAFVIGFTTKTNVSSAESLCVHSQL